MNYKKLLKHGFAMLLCVTFIMSKFQFQGISAIFDPIIPIEDNESDWEDKTVIYWDPKRDNETNSNVSRPVYIATDSNVSGHAGKATNSNVIKIINLATRSNACLASGSNAADGLTPDSAVENLNVAIRQAEKLSRKLSIEMSDIIIYAMNPMYILPEASYTVNGKGVTIVPWGERSYDDKYIFIVDGGQLTLDNIKIRPYSMVAEPEESSLVYMSSGIIQLGEEVESYGTFVLDYTQPMSIQEPVIELNSNFDFATNFRLDLRFPKGMEQDVTVINSLSPDKLTAEVFIDAFPVVNMEDEWELFVEEQSPEIRRVTINVDNVLKNTSKLTQKSLVARRGGNLNRLYLDPTNPNNQVLTISKTVNASPEYMEEYFEILFGIGLPNKYREGVYRAYVVDELNHVVTSEKYYRGINRTAIDEEDNEYIIVNKDSIDEVVQLKHGQKLVFTDLPLGTDYFAMEGMDNQYYKSVKVVENDVTHVISSEPNEPLSTNSRKIGEKQNSVEFINTNINVITITVSKQVEGNNVNRNKRFLFKINMRDSKGNKLASGTKLSYTGSVIEGSGTKKPEDGILTLNHEGSATFELQHGQKIKINCDAGQVRIQELDNIPEYNTSYRDDNSASVAGSDTGWVKLVTNKTFDFTNMRNYIVPAGVLIGKYSGMYLLILSMLMLVGMISAAHIYYYRKKR